MYCTGKYKALDPKAQTSQAQSVLLTPWALYFPVQHMCRLAHMR